jgi:hypothetical protein
MYPDLMWVGILVAFVGVVALVWQLYKIMRRP